jgi:hypothetical protein
MSISYSYSYTFDSHGPWQQHLPVWLGDYVLRVTFEDL